MNKVYRGQKHLLAHQFRYSVLKSLDAEKLTGFNIINLQIRFHNFIVRLTSRFTFEIVFCLSAKQRENMTCISMF